MIPAPDIRIWLVKNHQLLTSLKKVLILSNLCKMQLTALHDSYRSWQLPFSFKFLSLDLSLFHKWFWRVLCYAEEFKVEVSRVEPFGLDFLKVLSINSWFRHWKAFCDLCHSCSPWHPCDFVTSSQESRSILPSRLCGKSTFGCAMVIFSEVKGIVSDGFDWFPDILSLSTCRFAEFTFLTSLSCAYIFFRLISVLQIMFHALLVLALEGPSLK